MFKWSSNIPSFVFSLVLDADFNNCKLSSFPGIHWEAVAGDKRLSVFIPMAG